MNLRAKLLYHQIHPLKLLVDWTTGLAAAYLLWRHHLALGLAVGVFPPLIATAILLTWANLEPYTTSPLGKHVERYMTPATELLRLVGVALLWTGAWHHSWLLSVGGVVIIVAAWVRGKVWAEADDRAVQ